MDVLKSIKNHCLTVQALLITRLFFGFYYNVSKNTFIRIAARIYCILYAAVILQYFCIHLLDADFVETLFAVIMLCFFMLNVLHNLIFGEVVFASYLTCLRESNHSLGIGMHDKVPISAFVVIFIIAYKVYTFGDVAYAAPLYPVSFLFNEILAASVSLSNLTRIMTFELLYSRMTSLRVRIENALSIARRFEEGEQNMIQNLKNCIAIYNKLLNTLHSTGIPMKLLLFLDMTINLPKLLLIITIAITAFMPTSVFIEFVIETILAFLPGILIELAKSEVDAIQICITRQLLVYKDGSARLVIHNVLKYLQHRPLNYSILRVITLDLKLVLTAVGLITTYIIAFIQFSHFYG